MNNKLRIILALALIIMVVAVPFTVLAYTWEYYTEITITDTSGTDRTGIPVSISIKGQNLLDAGYINSTGSNTNMAEGASERNFGLYLNNAALLIPSLSADQSRTYRLYTGYSPAISSHGIIIGSSNATSKSNVTISDSASLELGNRFVVNMSGYIDTSAGNDKNLIWKEDSFRTYVSGEGNISSVFIDITTEWATPTSGPANCIDDDTATYSEEDVSAGQWSSWYTFNHTPIDRCYGMRYWATRENSLVDDIDIEMYYNSTWNEFWYGESWGASWKERYMAEPQTVTGLRWRFHNGAGSTKWGRLHEIDYQGEKPEVTATGVSSGEHNITVTADYINLSILVDSVEEDSIALNGTSVQNTNSDWILLENNVMPYLEYCEIFSEEGLSFHPTGFEDPAGYWDGESNIYDGDTGTAGSTTYKWTTSYLNLTLSSPAEIDRAWIYAGDYIADWQDANITLGFYYNASWHEVYDGLIANLTWVTLANPEGSQLVSKARIKSNNASAWLYIYEFAFGVSEATAWYQPNTMISGNTLPDRSGNGNDGTIAWGANDNLTISIDSTVECDATTPTPTEAGGVSDTVTAAQEPAGWYANESKLNTLPLYSMFNASAAEMEMPTQTLYVFVILGLATAVGLGTVLFTGSPLMAASITGFIIFAGVSTTMLGGWMIYVFAILAVAILYLARQH